MTQEEKQLLLKDLCRRLPYGVKCYVPEHVNPLRLLSITKIDKGTRVWRRGTYVASFCDDTKAISLIKPYLRPMSDMTKDEMSDFKWIAYEDCEYDNNDNPIHTGSWAVNCDYIDDMIDFLNSHHFDYGGLIEKCLAIEAPKNMYNIKN